MCRPCLLCVPHCVSVPCCPPLFCESQPEQWQWQPTHDWQVQAMHAVALSERAAAGTAAQLADQKQQAEHAQQEAQCQHQQLQMQPEDQWGVRPLAPRLDPILESPAPIARVVPTAATLAAATAQAATAQAVTAQAGSPTRHVQQQHQQYQQLQYQEQQQQHKQQQHQGKEQQYPVAMTAAPKLRAAVLDAHRCVLFAKPRHLPHPRHTLFSQAIDHKHHHNLSTRRHAWGRVMGRMTNG